MRLEFDPVVLEGLLSRLFSTIESRQDQWDARLESLEVLHSSILAKAFRGELVLQDPSDEPAAVLLERVRSQSAWDTKRRKRPTKRASGLTTGRES